MQINGKTAVAGVIGWPVSHSKSPLLHNFWFREYGINGAYVAFPVAPGRFESAISGLVALGLKGANVTVPYKEAALEAADLVTDEAARIGAANTLVVLEDGRIEARNTDCYGFTENLRHGAPGWKAAAAPAVVLGAGGASRAVLVGLLDAGVPEIRLLNRSRDKADTLSKQLGLAGSGRIRVMEWGQRSAALEDAGLLVNTTSLGMGGQPPLEIDLAALPAEAIVTDAVYTPLETPLLKAARQRGNGCVDGLGMLLYQAVSAFEAWFGVRPEVTPALRAHLLGAEMPVVLQADPAKVVPA